MKKVLTIAGSDCSGGAGIQADIKAMTVHKVYAMSVITALTAQNTTGVYGVFEVSPDFVEHQIDCVFTDIFPDAVKIGMVSNREIIDVIARKLRHYKASNIVVDPVMVSTSGVKLLNDDAVDYLISKLIPIADIITPNIPEAEILSGISINNTDGMLLAAKKISEMFAGSILIKGGHLDKTADDLLFYKQNYLWIREDRINNSNTHGTGCTLSSAIACGLANGYGIKKSVEDAKKYITGALRNGMDLGKGPGPLNHFYNYY